MAHTAAAHFPVPRGQAWSVAAVQPNPDPPALPSPMPPKSGETRNPDPSSSPRPGHWGVAAGQMGAWTSCFHPGLGGAGRGSRGDASRLPSLPCVGEKQPRRQTGLWTERRTKAKRKTLTPRLLRGPGQPASLLTQRLAGSPGSGATRWRSLCPPSCPEARPWPRALKLRAPFSRSLTLG